MRRAGLFRVCLRLDGGALIYLHAARQCLWLARRGAALAHRLLYSVQGLSRAPTRCDKQSFLHDMACCPQPQCKAGLEWLKEFPNPSIAQHQPRPRQRLNSVKKRKYDTPENSEMEMGDTD